MKRERDRDRDRGQGQGQGQGKRQRQETRDRDRDREVSRMADFGVSLVLLTAFPVLIRKRERVVVVVGVSRMADFWAALSVCLLR